MPESLNTVVDGFTQYTDPTEIQRDAAHDSELGNVGTSISLSVSYSASISWTVSWSA